MDWKTNDFPVKEVWAHRSKSKLCWHSSKTWKNPIAMDFPEKDTSVNNASHCQLLKRNSLHVGYDEQIFTILDYQFRACVLFISLSVYCTANKSQLGTACEERSSRSNSLHQKFEKNMYCLTFTPVHPIWKFHCVWLSIWGEIHINIDENQTPCHIMLFRVVTNDGNVIP